MPKFPLVLIEWVDSFGCSPHWQEYDPGKAPQPFTVVSAGYLVHDGQDHKVISPHAGSATADCPAQMCGDMTIPAQCVTGIWHLRRAGGFYADSRKPMEFFDPKPAAPPEAWPGAEVSFDAKVVWPKTPDSTTVVAKHGRDAAEARLAALRMIASARPSPEIWLKLYQDLWPGAEVGTGPTPGEWRKLYEQIWPAPEAKTRDEAAAVAEKACAAQAWPMAQLDEVLSETKDPAAPDPAETFHAKDWAEWNSADHKAPQLHTGGVVDKPDPPPLVGEMTGCTFTAASPAEDDTAPHGRHPNGVPKGGEYAGLSRKGGDPQPPPAPKGSLPPIKHHGDPEVRARKGQNADTK